MGMMDNILTWAKRILALGLFSTVAVFAWSYLWPKQDMASLNPANAIVCLGGGVTPRGVLHRGSADRARTCAALYQAGFAPVIVFTGGNSAGGPSAGQGSLPLLEHQDNLILVTDAFHLPRSWMSFRWAGATHLTLFPAKQDAAMEVNTQTSTVYLLREPLAIWFNLGRATLWSVASLMGEPSDNWLY